MKHLQGMLLNKIEIKVQNSVYGMLNTKNREENMYWNMPKHSLGNKFNIMIACGRGTEWLRVGEDLLYKYLYCCIWNDVNILLFKNLR